jgi:hypothetical protein
MSADLPQDEARVYRLPNTRDADVTSDVDPLARPGDVIGTG